MAQPDKTALEKGSIFTLRFSADGLIPAIAQSADDGVILMMAYMNEEALKKTLQTGEVHYYSRSRDAIWKKGESSGHTQKLVELRTDCDQDAILLSVIQKGPGACHVGYRSCFYRRATDPDTLETVGDLAYDPASIYGDAG